MRKDAHENRLEILKVARFLFAQQGGDISMRAIAAAAGVGVATLYRNFPTRGDLLLGITEQLAQEFESITARCRSEWDDDPAQAWRNFVHSIAGLHIAGLVASVVNIPELETLMTEIAQVQRTRIEPVAIDVLERAKKAGLLDPGVDLDRFRSGLATITRPLPHLPTLSVSQDQGWLVDVYLKGLRPG